MEWNKLEDDEEERGLIIAYTGKSFAIEAVRLYPRLVQEANDERDTIMGMQIIARCGELELARETQWGLGFDALFGDPNESPNKEFLEEVVSSLAPEAVYRAHVNIRVMQHQTEEYLKILREARSEMSYVTLTHEGNQIKLSLGLAQMVLFIKHRDHARDSIRPHRLQRIREDVAVAFDAQNKVMGHIGFDPENPLYRTSHGRFGCYNITQKGEL